MSFYNGLRWFSLRSTYVFILVTTILSLFACSHSRHSSDRHENHGSSHHGQSTDSVGGAQADHDHGEGLEYVKPWGSLKEVLKYGPVSMTRQPGRKDLAEAKKQGYEVIISLSHESELPFNEKGVVEGLGMKYVNIPILKGRPFLAETLERVTLVVEQYHDDSILMYSASGDRVAVWFAYHMTKDHHWTIEKSLEAAMRIGLKPESRAKVMGLFK